MTTENAHNKFKFSVPTGLLPRLFVLVFCWNYTTVDSRYAEIGSTERIVVVAQSDIRFGITGET